MTVNYWAIARKNPGDQTQAAKFSAQLKSSGGTTTRQLVRQISSISTVSAADSTAVIEAFLEVIPLILSDGKIVRLGDFGSFSITVKGEGATDADELNRHYIKKTSVKFRPGKIFRQTIIL
jgi:predicted histone-like DNA-binding protein